MPPSSSRGSGRGTRTGNISRHSRTRNRVTVICTRGGSRGSGRGRRSGNISTHSRTRNRVTVVRVDESVRRHSLD